MQDLADNQRIGRKDLSNAVKNLMGLDVLEMVNIIWKKQKESLKENLCLIVLLD